MKKILIISIISFCILFTFGCEESKFLRSGEVTCKQLEKVKNYENVKLIDVREADEYNEYHLDGAINIPYENIVAILSNDNISLETPIIVYCKSGKRSTEAYNSLKSAGYKHIYNLGAISKCN